MSGYLNRASLEVYLTFAAIEGSCEKLLMTGCAFRNGDKCKELLEQILDTAKKVVENIDAGLDGEAIYGAMKRSEGMQMVCISEGDPRQKGQGYYVDPKDMEVLTEGVMGPCLFCEMSGNEIRECNVRKALSRSGVPGFGKAACPYMR